MEIKRYILVQWLTESRFGKTKFGIREKESHVRGDRSGIGCILSRLGLFRSSSQHEDLRRSRHSSPCMAFGALRMIPLLRIQLSKVQSIPQSQGDGDGGVQTQFHRRRDRGRRTEILACGQGKHR